MRSLSARPLAAMAATVVLLISFSGRAHVHWVMASLCNPPAGAQVGIEIASGHGFPESSITLQDRLIHEPRVLAPDGSTRALTTEAADGKRTGTVIFEVEGVHLLSYCLKKPQQSDPMFCAKTIVPVGSAAAGEVSRKLGSIVEIVPGKNPLLLKQGDGLPLQVFHKGEPVEATIEVNAGGKKTFMLGTDEQGRATLILKREGPYLLTTEVAGKGATLTFCFFTGAP